MYTHDFKFKIGDGGQFIEGEIGFEADGTVSYKMTSFSEPIKSTTFKKFDVLASLIKEIYTEFGGFKMIRFKEKGQS